MSSRTEKHARTVADLLEDVDLPKGAVASLKRRRLVFGKILEVAKAPGSREVDYLSYHKYKVLLFSDVLLLCPRIDSNRREEYRRAHSERWSNETVSSTEQLNRSEPSEDSSKALESGENKKFKMLYWVKLWNTQLGATEIYVKSSRRGRRMLTIQTSVRSRDEQRKEFTKVLSEHFVFADQYDFRMKIFPQIEMATRNSWKEHRIKRLRFVKRTARNAMGDEIVMHDFRVRLCTPLGFSISSHSDIGVFVAAVAERGFAQLVGIQAGDLLLSMDGESLDKDTDHRSVEQRIKMLKETEEGRKGIFFTFSRVEDTPEEVSASRATRRRKKSVEKWRQAETTTTTEVLGQSTEQVPEVIEEATRMEEERVVEEEEEVEEGGDDALFLPIPSAEEDDLYQEADKEVQGALENNDQADSLLLDALWRFVISLKEVVDQIKRLDAMKDSLRDETKDVKCKGSRALRKCSHVSIAKKCKETVKAELFSESELDKLVVPTLTVRQICVQKLMGLCEVVRARAGADNKLLEEIFVLVDDFNQEAKFFNLAFVRDIAEIVRERPRSLQACTRLMRDRKSVSDQARKVMLELPPATGNLLSLSEALMESYTPIAEALKDLLAQCSTEGLVLSEDLLLKGILETEKNYGKSGEKLRDLIQNSGKRFSRSSRSSRSSRRSHGTFGL